MNEEVTELRYRCCFLILHYKTINETRACIESILRLDGIEKDAVVIVDNSCSISDTGTCLAEEYKGTENIHFVSNTKNCFFSHGNNIGYKYAKKLGCKFIIAANSDILFLQKKFTILLERTMKKHSFYVCGPDIVEPVSGSGTSPIAWRCLTENEAENDINYYRRKLEELSGGESGNLNQSFKRRCPRFFLSVRNWQMEVVKSIISRKNPYPVLQGSCLILSWLFIKENEELFYPETELYGEEQLLTFRCEKKRYKMRYATELKVIHKGSISISNEYQDIYQKEMNFYKRIIKARKIYLEYIRKQR